MLGLLPLPLAGEGWEGGCSSPLSGAKRTHEDLRPGSARSKMTQSVPADADHDRIRLWAAASLGTRLELSAIGVTVCSFRQLHPCLRYTTRAIQSDQEFGMDCVMQGAV